MTTETADAKTEGLTPTETAAPEAVAPEAATPASAPLNIQTSAAPVQLPTFAEDATLSEKVVQVLNTIHDPEIPVNIYELGLVYDVDVAEDGEVNVTMTLTTPNCPVAGSLPGEVETKIAAIEGVTKAHVNLVWEPIWTPERMSEAAKLELGWLG
ncbi:MAG TPA: SUF system Fe-S cluster assembly protein [Alphaproteobacteria bacterium]|jgi:FeS assembly SUF system protein